jgi:hypothetical protein
MCVDLAAPIRLLSMAGIMRPGEPDERRFCQASRGALIQNLVDLELGSQELPRAQLH